MKSRILDVKDIIIRVHLAVLSHSPFLVFDTSAGWVWIRGVSIFSGVHHGRDGGDACGRGQVCHFGD